MSGLRVVSSRFCVLPDDDTTDWKAPNNKKNNHKQQQQQQNKQPKGKAKKSKSDLDDLRAVAFGGGKKSKGGGNKAKDKKNNVTEEQFNQWKEKDEKMVNDRYAEDLEAALLESKISYGANEKIEVIEKKSEETKKKKTTLTLDQFNNIMSDQLEKKVSKKMDDAKEDLQTDFFENLDSDLTQVLNREKRLDQLRRGPVPEPSNMSPANSELVALCEKLNRNLTLKEVELNHMKRENVAVNQKYQECKDAFKKLTEILKEAKMKERATILLENEKLKTLRDELTEEVTRLTRALEQETTKNKDLVVEIRKLQERKGSLSK